MDLAAILIKTSILLACAITAALAFRRSARRVHQMWTVVFAAAIAMPALTEILPPLGLPMVDVWTTTPASMPHPAAQAVTPLSAVDPAAPPSVGPALTSGSGPVDAPSSATAWPSPRSLAIAVWMAGAIVALAMIVVSLVRVRRLARSAVELRDPAWRRSVTDICGQLGLRDDVRLLLSPDVDTPMAGQLLRRAIFLPADATDWTDDRRRAVLGHELAHLAAHDPRRHLGARVTLALYWFHPLAWIAAAMDAHASEEACDEAVVCRLGIRPSSYARVLLEAAESASWARFPLVGLPGARRSRLERRVTAILSDPPRSVRTALPFPAIGCGILAVLLASAEPRARATRLQDLANVADANVMSGETRLTAPANDAPIPTAVPNRFVGAGSRPGAQLPDVACGAHAAAVPQRGGLIASELVGPRGFARRLLRSFGELSVCLAVEDVPSTTFDRPVAMLAAAARGVLETRHAGTVQRLEIATSRSAAAGANFSINGTRRPSEARVAEWQRQTLAVLGTTWELASRSGDRRQAAELERRQQGEVAELLRIVQAMDRTPDATGGPQPGPPYDVSRPGPPDAAPAPTSTHVACDIATPSAFGRAQPRRLRETFGDLQVCVRIDEGNIFETIRPSELLRRASYAVLEAKRGDLVHQFVITGGNPEQFLVNGVSRPIDAAVLAWKERLVDVLDTSWNIFALQGREGLLNGRIGEIAGRVSLGEIRPEEADRFVQSLRAEIAALRVDERIAGWTTQRNEQIERLRSAMTAIQ